MILKGQKRKLPPEDPDHTEETTAELEGQRQLVLYISLNKYQHGQVLAEPSLRRSVLIANTLRQITLEAAMGKDGGSPTPCGAAAAVHTKEDGCTGMATPDRQFTVTVHNSHSAAASDFSSPPDPQFGVASIRHQADFQVSTPDVCIEGGSEDWESMSSDPDFSLSAAISSILTTLESSIDGNHGGSLAAPRTPLRSLENLAALEGDGASKQGVRGPSWGGWERAEESRATDSCVEVMRSSYLGDLALDDIFQDIDTSLLERELGVLGARGEGHPSGEELLRYLPSLSSTVPSFSSFSSSSSSSSSPFLSINQNMWCLPSFSSFNPTTTPSGSPFFSSSSSFPSPSSSSYPGQGLARDGLELDHVMEVLVES
ncbi:SERTA domain-containing protein 3 [Gadus chalcogrammus]|uniref:SERTA domain-containing protein 3 n=1 Tax=Gadus chalcogrammus TaxID=1042646 RepID=UPI0024C4D2AC|nr:SERTA domain-containing protein 3 [Gadus chalcogrammus]XP_056466596.1 SERTA domain-containing protein 3 [Gadus chalcogrammus]XP_056466597.1 SERTA domain-containing protein 3 [Gadus chalcogrammus]